MPLALGFQSGRRCGSAETCSARCSRSCRYARSMSLTMIARCWNERSLLRASGGIGQPRGARYSVSSIASSPSRRRTTRMQPEDALEALVVLACHLDVRHGLEPEDVGEEAYRAVHVRHGDPDR